MSIIGPRPLLVRYLPYYTENERHRHCRYFGGRSFVHPQRDQKHWRSMNMILTAQKLNWMNTVKRQISYLILQV